MSTFPVISGSLYRLFLFVLISHFASTGAQAAEPLREYQGEMNGAQCVFFLSWATPETVVGFVRYEGSSPGVLTLSGTQPNGDEILFVASEGVKPVVRMMVKRADEDGLEQWKGEMKPVGEDAILPVVFARDPTVDDSGGSIEADADAKVAYDKYNLDFFLIRYVDRMEISHWTYAQLRYAINYIYARNGYPFKGNGGPIREVFNQMEWYRPSDGLSMEEIDSRMNQYERSNIKVLAALRDEKN